MSPALTQVNAGPLLVSFMTTNLVNPSSSSLVLKNSLISSFGTPTNEATNEISFLVRKEPDGTARETFLLRISISTSVFIPNKSRFSLFSISISTGKVVTF